MKVIIDLIIAKVFDDHVDYSNFSILEINQNPDDEIISYLQKLNLNEYAKYIIHSTSWHYANGKVFLTYLVIIPNSSQFQLSVSVDILNLKLAKGQSSYKPSPKFLNTDNIIRHAFRHLSYLIKHDHTCDYDTFFSKEQKKYLMRIYDDVAGEISS